MGCGASADAADPRPLYAWRLRLLGGLNLYNNAWGNLVTGGPVGGASRPTATGRFEGRSDPYVVLTATGTRVKHKSSAKANDCNPVWNEEFYFNTDTRTPVLTIKVHDKSVLPGPGGDETLGEASVPLHGLLGRDGERTLWVPLRGHKAKGEIGVAVVEIGRASCRERVFEAV